MDLAQYPKMGIIEFTSNVDEDVNRNVTQRFEEYVQTAQPGVRFIELGSQQSVLQSVNAQSLDINAITRIGEKYGVTALFVGELTFSKVEPKINVTDIVNLGGSIQENIHGTISSKLYETQSGASAWTRSDTFTRKMSGISNSKDGGIKVKTNNSEDPHYGMIPELVNSIMGDFRPTYVNQPAK